jgi:hypothetical protein
MANKIKKKKNKIKKIKIFNNCYWISSLGNLKRQTIEANDRDKRKVNIVH